VISNVKVLYWLLGGVAALCLALTCAAYVSIHPCPERLEPPFSSGRKLQVLDRSGAPLSLTFANGWNLSDQRQLHEVPPLLQRAVLESEDKRFYEHSGVDWRARMHAILQNIRAGRVVRGASTITEQVVGMLHKRPRSVWSRFIEGLEATQLEKRFSKGEILEFYLNQVPYAAKRRGIAQAARYFWDRDLETLSAREQLALAVMIRAPERLDLYKDINRVSKGISLLANRLHQGTFLTHDEYRRVTEEQLSLRKGSLGVRADHFVRHVHAKVSSDARRIVTTLNSPLQARIQSILDGRVADLREQQVSDGAALVVDNQNGEVIAWVNAGEFSESEGSQIDAIITPRQPGSTLKPFVYALALSRGWSAATIIDDSPLAEGVGAGLHTYRNYSRGFYGPITLREALGNSLNIPAIRAIHYTGTQDLLQLLHTVGFSSLSKPADFYGEGLALGNGEVTLYELVQAYATFAHRGIFRPLKAVRSPQATANVTNAQRVLSPEVSSLISSILSDPHARRLEFGTGGLLRFPIQTAIKTGTSTDYRDAWAVGYSENFTVGVWMGNLNRTSMHEVTGSRGPALVLRSIFAELERGREAKPLFESPRLIRQTVCSLSGLIAQANCPQVEERFIPGTQPSAECSQHHHAANRAETLATNDEQQRTLQIKIPTPNLHIALDPRIPDDQEALSFEVSSKVPLRRLFWLVDGKHVGETAGEVQRFLWKLQAGQHEVRVVGETADSGAPIESDTVRFLVK
jgi:penicillin-binding protein 1C